MIKLKYYMLCLYFIAGTFFWPFSVYAATSEKTVNAAWCLLNNGIEEFRTKYGTYVDCLTDKYAVEAEFDYNWKESIGQSLHYAEATKKDAAILFIHRKDSNKNYLPELQNVIEAFKLPIKIFEIYQ